jgi:hypothetical protein
MKRGMPPLASTILAQLKGRQPAGASQGSPASTAAQPDRFAAQVAHPNRSGHPGLLQPKMSTPAQSLKQPAAPAAYRPQPTPHVLQLKGHNARPQQQATASTHMQPTLANRPGQQQQRNAAAMQSRHSGQSPQAPFAVQRKQVAGAQAIVQRKALTSPAPPSSSSIHSRKVIQRAEQKVPTPNQSNLSKEQRRMNKANALMENQSTNMNPQDDVALNIKNKVCSNEPVKMKVLILSDATPKHKEKYSSSNLKMLSEGFSAEHYEVTPTYYHDKNVYDTNEVLPSPWHLTDINQLQTYPPEQFDLILGRNLICFCNEDSITSCGGITEMVPLGKIALQNVSAKLNLKKGARAILTIPLGTMEEENRIFWTGAINAFNNASTDFVALTISDQVKGFYGIKIKPKKK